MCGTPLKDDPIAAKRLIGYVSDDHVLYEGLTGREFVNFVCDVFDVPSAVREERLERYLDLFSLRDAMGKQIKTYSHGMKQKLNIIGSLVHEPKIWILDEPMTGLDPKSSFELKRLMREHADKGNCVFFSSHVLDVVEKVCDRVGIIDGGRLLADCTLSELKTTGLNESLEELFLKLTDDEEHTAAERENTGDGEHSAAGRDNSDDAAQSVANGSVNAAKGEETGAE